MTDVVQPGVDEGNRVMLEIAKSVEKTSMSWIQIRRGGEVDSKQRRTTAALGSTNAYQVRVSQGHGDRVPHWVHNHVEDHGSPSPEQHDDIPRFVL